MHILGTCIILTGLNPLAASHLPAGRNTPDKEKKTLAPHCESGDPPSRCQLRRTQSRIADDPLHLPQPAVAKHYHRQPSSLRFSVISGDDIAAPARYSHSRLLQQLPATKLPTSSVTLLLFRCVISIKLHHLVSSRH